MGESAGTPWPVLQTLPHAAPGARVLIGLVEAGKARQATNPCRLAAGGRRLRDEGGAVRTAAPGLALQPADSHTSCFAAALTLWEVVVTPLHPRGKWTGQVQGLAENAQMVGGRRDPARCLPAPRLRQCLTLDGAQSLAGELEMMRSAKSGCGARGQVLGTF